MPTHCKMAESMIFQIQIMMYPFQMMDARLISKLLVLFGSFLRHDGLLIIIRSINVVSTLDVWGSQAQFISLDLVWSQVNAPGLRRKDV